MRRGETDGQGVPFVPREGLARAPLIFPLAGLSVSLASVNRGIPAVVATLLAPLVVAGLVLVLSERRPPRLLPYAGGLALMSFIASIFCCTVLVRQPPLPEGAVSGRGTVVLERSWGARRAVLVDAEADRYLLKLPPDKLVMEGDLLSFSGVARRIAPREGSSFREDLYWSARGARIEIEASSTSRGDGGPSLASWRTALRRRMLLTLPPRTRGYMLAAVLGVRDPDLDEAHRRWGTSHLLAVSGFHVGLVALGLWKILTSALVRTRVPRRVAVAAASLVLWGYALLAGGAPGALRAAIMLQLLLLGVALGRRGNALNSVAMAALLLLLWRPAWFFDVGWRLSVIAAMLLAALAERCLSIWTLPVSSVLVWLAAYPQVAAVFGSVPLAGLLLNLVALPLFSALYPLAFFLSAPLLVGLPGGRLLASAAEGLFTLWEIAADSLAGLTPWAAGWNPVLAALGGGLFVLIVSGGLHPLRGRTVAGAGLFLLIAVLIL